MKKIFTLLLITFSVLVSAKNTDSDSDEIVACPTVSISYGGGPFCPNGSPQSVTLTGTGAYLGGTFSSAPGLILNATTGEITLSGSTSSTYTITYTIAPNGSCPAIIATTNVTIKWAPYIAPEPNTNQTVCPGASIESIIYNVHDATGATVTGLPVGVTGTYVEYGAVDAFVISGTPTTSGTFNYNVTTTGGCSPTSTRTGTIRVETPTVTLNSTTVCQDPSTTVTATTGSPGTYTYVWTTPPGISNPGNVTSFTTSVSGTYSVYITNNSGGCSSPIASTTLTINPILTATASSPSNLCSGTATEISLMSNTPNTTFTWTVAQTGVTGATNGAGSIISQVLTTTTSNVGQVVYTITPFADSCSGNPITVTVTVNPALQVIVNSTQQSICSGGTTNIILTSNIPGTTYSWNLLQSGVTGGSIDVNNTNGVINQTLTTTPGTITGQAIYGVTPFTNNCVGTTFFITVNVNPIPTVTAAPASQTICSGNTTNIALTSNVSGTTFSWTVIQSGLYGAASGTGNAINQTLSTVGLTQGHATYTITPSVNGCTGTPISVTVTVNPTPEVFSSTVPLNICSGESLGIAVTPNIPGTSIIWTVVENGVTGASDGSGSETTPGAGIPIDQILTTTGNTPGTVTYMIAPTRNGCTGHQATITVRVYPLPEINIPDGLICMDEITNNVRTPYVLDTGLSTSDYLFEWYFNGSPISGAEESTYSASMPGSYWVNALNTITGCASSSTANVIESYAAQSASAAYEEQFDGNYSITVTTNASGTYLYQMDGGELQTSNVFSDVPFGQHTIHVTDTNACSDIMINIDLPESTQRDLAISPNPVTDILTIRNDNMISKISVINHLGQLVFEKESNNKNLQIDLSDLNAGIYFIIIDSDRTQNFKIVKN